MLCYHQLSVAVQVASSAVGDVITSDGRPQLVLDNMFQSIGDGSLAHAMHSSMFPQAILPAIDVSTSTDAMMSLRNLLR
jgi:hypothetical protein